MQQQEIDYIEETDGILHAYEFKWSTAKLPKINKTFAQNYPKHDYAVISPENYQDFVCGKL